MTIYLGADHRGFRLKERLKAFLVRRGYTVRDLGAKRVLPRDDYPQYGFAVGRAVRKDAKALGIAVCGSGIGINIAANKIQGIRAGLAMSVKQAKAGRREDRMNVLTLAADFTTRADAERIAMAFLTTVPSKAARYVRRARALNQYRKEV